MGAELALVNPPGLRRRRGVLSSLSLERRHPRVQFGDGLVLALRLVRQLPKELQDLADEVLRPPAGIQWLISVAYRRD
jgi:hypothetical protein